MHGGQLPIDIASAWNSSSELRKRSRENGESLRQVKQI